MIIPLDDIEHIDTLIQTGDGSIEYGSDGDGGDVYEEIRGTPGGEWLSLHDFEQGDGFGYDLEYDPECGSIYYEYRRIKMLKKYGLKTSLDMYWPFFPRKKEINK